MSRSRTTVSLSSERCTSRPPHTLHAWASDGSPSKADTVAGKLWLGYTEFYGSPELRRLVAGLYREIAPDQVMVHAGDRDAAVDRLRRALDETEIAGIQTTLPFHRFVACDASFRAADLSTGWVGEHWDGPAEQRGAVEAAQLAAGLAAMDAAIAAGGAGVAAFPPTSGGAATSGPAPVLFRLTSIRSPACLSKVLS